MATASIPATPIMANSVLVNCRVILSPPSKVRRGSSIGPAIRSLIFLEVTLKPKLGVTEFGAALPHGYLR